MYGFPIALIKCLKMVCWKVYRTHQREKQIDVYKRQVQGNLEGENMLAGLLAYLVAVYIQGNGALVGINPVSYTHLSISPLDLGISSKGQT